MRELDESCSAGDVIGSTHDGGQKGGEQSGCDRCGTEQVFRQNYAAGNEGLDHQLLSGRLEVSRRTKAEKKPNRKK